MSQCRHCHPFEMGATYASWLLMDGQQLKDVVESLESRIIPCTTAMCPQCNQVSILSAGNAASVVRTVFMWKRLATWIDDADALDD